MKTVTVITVLLTSMALSACSNMNKNDNSPSSRKTTGDIMKGQYGSSKKNQPETFRKGTGSWKVSPAHTPNYSDYTRTEAKELNGIFPRLPNPDLCMYVYPHLSGENATIPGYTSCFSMYDKNEYALPGEMLATWQHKK
ncbi:MAG: TIGR03751 family conjugal transfer lipoprotein [Methylococcaceae bacterium]|nr:TIGR03751 family conjugal transfer lipoprotein [Methylococcaceae bacterium]